jgi:hypothetical protein
MLKKKLGMPSSGLPSVTTVTQGVGVDAPIREALTRRAPRKVGTHRQAEIIFVNVLCCYEADGTGQIVIRVEQSIGKVLGEPDVKAATYHHRKRGSRFTERGRDVVGEGN